MKAQISITIDDQVYERVKDMAIDEGRSISNMIEQLLKSGLKKKRVAAY